MAETLNLAEEVDGEEEDEKENVVEEKNEVEEEEEIEEWRKDVRMQYIRSMVEKLGNIKTDQWIKMIEKDTNLDVIFQFLDNVQVRKLLFVKAGATLAPSLSEFPTIKGKFIYFLRRSDHEEITDLNYAQAMLVGSCSENPIRDFSIYVNNAIVPLLMNPLNQENWPKVLSDEMRRKLQDLRNSITEAMGAINDRTVLPNPVTLPALMAIAPAVLRGDLTELTDTLRESVEQIVLRWSRSVNAYVVRSSYDIFKVKKYSTIDDEVEFWRKRLDNLKNIFNQLRTKETKTLALIIEAANSVYVNQMKRIISNVAAGYEEANDINLYLKPLQYQLEKMRSTEFPEAMPFIAPLLHTVVMIWSRSTYIASNKRIVHLFKLLNNKIFELVCDTLNPQSIFAGDIADTLEKVTKTLKNMSHYKEIYVECRAKLKEFKSQNAEMWSFDPDEIFTDFDVFVKRLEKINEMLGLLFVLKKMEDIVFGGHTGKHVTQSVQKICDSVSVLLDSLKDIPFNVLDLDETENFERLTAKFEVEITDLQQKLAKQYATSFDECNTITKCIKLIVNLGNTLHLPMVYQEISPKFEKIARMLVSEVIDVENIFQSQCEAMSKKPMTDALVWCGKLKSRLTEQTKYFESQKIKLFDNEYGHHATIRYAKIVDAIENWEREYLAAEKQVCLRDSEEIMNGPLFHIENDKLCVNIRSELDDILQGINRMTMSNIEFDEEPLKLLWAKRDDLCTLKMKLYRTTEWYNYMQFNVCAQEKDLVRPNSSEIGQMMQDYLSKYTWNAYDDDDLDKFVTTLDQLYRRTVMVHDKIRKMMEKMHSWCDEPLFKRKIPTEDDECSLLNVNDRDRIVGARYRVCSETQKLIRTTMKENFCLLTNKHIQFDANNAELSIDDVAIFELKLSEEEMEAYAPYEEYIDEMVRKNVLQAIEVSLRYIKSELQSTSPLFEVCFSLDVENRKSIFCPSMDVQTGEGFVSFITTLMVCISVYTDFTELLN